MKYEELEAMTQAIDGEKWPETVTALQRSMIKMARENVQRYTNAARECLRWARIDRESGDRESAYWYLISAHRHRTTAAEWSERLRRKLEKIGQA